MDPNLKHLKEYEAELERLQNQDPEYHFQNVAGLIDTPKNILNYRIEATKYMIDLMNSRLVQ